MATHETHQDLLERIKLLGGLQSSREASLALRATLMGLGERLGDEERELLARALPHGDASALYRGKRRSAFDVAEFFHRVRRREGTSLGFAREHAQVVCRVLGESLPEVARRTIDDALPDSLAELFRPPPESQSPPDHPVARRERHDTLATGRMGSSHPLSESRPPSVAQSHSVVLEANPHGDRKLSSGSS